MTGTQKRRKVYVDVNADHMRDGTAIPHKITFEDGIYEVDKITARCRAASRQVAGMGIASANAILSVFPHDADCEKTTTYPDYAIYENGADLARSAPAG